MKRTCLSPRAVWALFGLGSLLGLAGEAAVPPTPPTPPGTTAPHDSIPGQPRFARVPGGNLAMGRVTLDPKYRCLSFPLTVNQSKGLVEYAVVTVVGPTHESVFRTDAEPLHIHLGMLLLVPEGGEPEPVSSTMDEPKGPPVFAEVSWKSGDRTVRHALEEFIVTTNNGKTLASGPWIYTGSVAGQTGVMASSAGTVITIQPDRTALINNPRPDRFNDDLHHVNEAIVPPDDAEIRLTIYLEEPAPRTEPDALIEPAPIRGPSPTAHTQ